MGRKFIVENRWTCSSCRAQNRGRDVVCASCASPKEQHEKDDAPKTASRAEAVTDAALLGLAAQKAHWECGFCGSKQRDPDGKCANCGAAGAEARELDVLTATSRAAQKQFWLDRLKAHQKSWRLGARLRRHWILYSLVGAVVLTVGICGVVKWMHRPRDVEAKVTAIHWTHTKHLGRKTLMHDSGWGARADAFNVSCVSKYYGTESCNPYQCNPHQVSYSCNCHECGCSTTCRDLGNGFSECSESCSSCCDTCYRTEYDTCYHQCPVYRDWCSYDWYDWPIVDTRVTEGTTHETTWPVLEAPDENHRVTDVAVYSVTLERGKQAWIHHPPTLGEFTQFDLGELWKARVTYDGKKLLGVKGLAGTN